MRQCGRIISRVTSPGISNYILSPMNLQVVVHFLLLLLPLLRVSLRLLPLLLLLTICLWDTDDTASTVTATRTSHSHGHYHYNNLTRLLPLPIQLLNERKGYHYKPTSGGCVRGSLKPETLNPINPPKGLRLCSLQSHLCF